MYKIEKEIFCLTFKQNKKTMKKIAIITHYTNSLNYGGLLQAFALVFKLEQLGYVADQIQLGERSQEDLKKNIFMKAKEHGTSYALLLIVEHIKSLILKINIDLSKTIQIFCNYRESIPHTSKIDEDKLSVLNKYYDIFIAGSDQIWHPKWTKKAFFLNFVDSNKIKLAYAASIGRYDFSSYEVNFLKKFIQTFDYVSVREKSASLFLKKTVNFESVQVLDPTMLLTKQEWEKQEEFIEHPNKYIFCYLLEYSSKRLKFIRNLSKILKLPIIAPVHAAQKKSYASVNDKMYLEYAVGPKEWVFLLHNAEYVITDSFHGTVFSIIFQKNFWHILRKAYFITGNMNSRVYSLLHDFLLEDRFINIDEKINKQKVTSPIVYEKIERILVQERKHSLEYLITGLNTKSN